MTRSLLALHFGVMLLSSASVRASDDLYEELSSRRLEELSKMGADGDAWAARRVFLYYSLEASDVRLADWWEYVAAENGSVEVQFGLWVKYEKANNPHVARRALYWLRRAAAAGHAEAIRRLEVLDDPSTQ